MTYPDPQSTTAVEVAFGADIANPASWAWTDVTDDLPAQAITINRGRQDEQADAEPGDVTLILDNQHGHYTPDHPLSPHYPNVVTGVPIRITVQGSVRFVGQVASWEPVWPEGDLSDLTDLSQLEDEDALRGHSLVTVRAAGILQRLQQASSPLRSAIYRATMAQPLLGAYWPLEDHRDASFAASPVPGVSAARLWGKGIELEVGAEAVAPGSGPSVRLTAGVTVEGAVQCTVPLSTEDGWAVESCFRIEEDTPNGIIWGMFTRDTLGNTWTVRASLSGEDLTLQLQYTPFEGSTVTLDTQLLARDTFHQVRAIARRVGTSRYWEWHADGRVLGSATASGGTSPTSAGNVSYVELLANEIVVGHAAWYDTNFSVPSTWRAVEGWAGETALDRFERMCLEERVPFQGPPLLAWDTFNRTEVDAWGTSDSGHSWTTHGTATGFAVSSGQGTIDAPAGVVRGASLTPDLTDVDIRAQVITQSCGIETRLDLTSGFASRSGYSLFISDFFDLQIYRLDGGAATLLAGDQFDPDWYAAPMLLRAQAFGPLLRLKLWPASAPEPSLWTVEATDATYAMGRVALITSEDLTFFDDFELREVVRSALLGPQQIATLVDNLQAAAEADGGILSEARDELGLTFRPLAALYGQDAALVLDANGDNQGDITNPFAPVMDDQAVRNDVTVTRTDGSSARAIDSADIAKRGLRDVEVELNLASDVQLAGQAGWRLHLGTWPGMRYPAVTPALNARAGLIDSWLPLDAGGRIDVTNLPPQHPTDAVQLLMQGYAETIRPTDWEVEVNCSPYGPYVVGARRDISEMPGPADPVRRDTAGSQLAAEFVAGTEATMSVETTQGPLWGVTGASNMHFPLDVNVAGARIRVTGIAAAVGQTQAFTVSTTVANNINKTIPAGTAVRLWQRCIRAL